MTHLGDFKYQRCWHRSSGQDAGPGEVDVWMAITGHDMSGRLTKRQADDLGLIKQSVAMTHPEPDSVQRSEVPC